MSEQRTMSPIPPSIPPAERGPLWHAVFAAAFVQDRETMMSGGRISYDAWIEQHSYSAAEVACGIADAAVAALARVDKAAG